MTLEDYFIKTEDNNTVDHSIRFTRYSMKDGTQYSGFYIHPEGVHGDTLEFVVIGNKIIPLDEVYNG